MTAFSYWVLGETPPFPKLLLLLHDNFGIAVKEERERRERQSGSHELPRLTRGTRLLQASIPPLSLLLRMHYFPYFSYNMNCNCTCSFSSTSFFFPCFSIKFLSCLFLHQLSLLHHVPAHSPHSQNFLPRNKAKFA